MNAIGWLAGGGSAPLVIGIVAQRYNSLGIAIALASAVYIAAAIFLAVGATFFVTRDAAAMALRPART